LREGDELLSAGAWEQARSGRNQRTLQVVESLSGWVAATGEPLLVNDLTHDDRLLPEHRARRLQAGDVASLGVPLRLGGEVSGARAFNAERTPPLRTMTEMWRWPLPTRPPLLCSMRGCIRRLSSAGELRKASQK